jgi:DNA-binding transcriptional MerR regulator
MKVSELARRAGVTKETIHFYLRQGLLPRPRKAGRNMAFYDESHLERITLIKRLQHERYLPLEVIKQLVRAERAPGPELDILGELLSLSSGREGPSEPGRAVSRAELVRRGGLSAAQLDALEAAGLVAPRDGRYGASDALVIELIAAAQAEAGFSPELTVEVFALYRRHLEGLAAEEARLYGRAIVSSPSPLRSVEGLRRARAATNRFLLVERARLVQREIERYLGEVERAVADDSEPPLYPASPSLRAAGADDRAARSPDDELDELESKLRAQPADALRDALLGAALVRRARRALRTEGGRDAMRLATEGLAALAASERGRAASPRERLLGRLVRGRVWTGLPTFFGHRERGLDELRAVAAHAGAHPSERWMAANACWFAALVLPPAEARGFLERAAALDGDGPLTARARRRLQEIT